MSNLNELTIAQLKKAVSIKEKVAELESELASLLGTPSKAAPAAKKGGMSAAGRAAVAAAQKRRWAKIKATNAKSAPVSAPKPATTPAVKAAAPKPAKKWKLSAAGLAKIKAANKAYWAKKKAGK